MEWEGGGLAKMICYWQYIYYCLHTETPAWRKTLLYNNAGNHLLYANTVTHKVSHGGGKQHIDIPQVVSRYACCSFYALSLQQNNHCELNRDYCNQPLGWFRKNTQHLTFTFHKMPLRTFTDPLLLEMRHVESWEFPVRSDILLETVDTTSLDSSNCSHVMSVQILYMYIGDPYRAVFFWEAIHEKA